jgi:hypothetical protein
VARDCPQVFSRQRTISLDFLVDIRIIFVTPVRLHDSSWGVEMLSTGSSRPEISSHGTRTGVDGAKPSTYVETSKAVSLEFPAVVRVGSAAPCVARPWPTLAEIEREAGRLLRCLREQDRYHLLGFMRFSEYAVEGLGVSLRTAQEWMRLDSKLEELPLVAAAFEAREITSGHVRLLTRVATAESEWYWLGLALRLKVTAFADAIEAWQRHVGEGCSTAPSSRDELEGGSRAPRIEPVEPLDQDDDETRLLLLEIPVKAWCRAAWREAVAFIRRLAGSALAHGESLEWALAESAAAIGGDESEPAPAAGLRPAAIAWPARPATVEADALGVNPPAPGERGFPQQRAGRGPSTGDAHTAASRPSGTSIKHGPAQSSQDGLACTAEDSRGSAVNEPLDGNAIRSLHRQLKRLMAT